MITRIVDCFQITKQTIQEALQTHNYYLEREGQTYSSSEIMHSLRFVLGSHATDYRRIMEVQQPLRVVTRYLLGSQQLEEAEELLAVEEQALLASAKYSLFMYKQYLEQVVPANIAFYHFIREKNYHGHIAVVRYVMVVGLGRKDQNVFHKLKSRQRLELLRLLSDWLFTLIHYRCSAIYLQSSCVDPLIRQTYLLLSAMLGFDKHSQILHSLLEGEINELFNKLLYISGFVLCMGLPAQDNLAVHTVLVVLRKLMTSVTHQKINFYLPSYLFANQIGYVPAPYTHLILYQLLIQFAISQHRGSNGSGEHLVDPQYPVSLLTDVWSIIALLSEEYPALDKTHLHELVRVSLPNLESKSMIRAFLVRTALNEHLELEDAAIGSYLIRNKQPYLVGGRVVGLQTFCKNYHIVMDKEYLNILREAAKGRMLKLQEPLIWKEILNYNKYEILTQAEYIQTKTYKHNDDN